MREGRIAMNVLDWSVPYLKYFEEMTRIPHGSFHEKAYSDYLAAWADFGAADNVIPSYGAVRFTTDQPAREVAAQVEQWDAVFRKELEFSDPGLQITLSPAQAQTFHEVTGRELQPVFVHGGIEAGYFKEMYPEMDIVTIGPLVLDEHMVTERLDLKSFDEIWTVLVKLLASL